MHVGRFSQASCAHFKHSFAQSTHQTTPQIRADGEKLHRNGDSVAVVVAVSGKVDPPSLKSGRSPDEPRARQSGSIVNQRYLRIRRPGARLIRIVSIREIKPFEVHPRHKQQHSRPADKASGLQRDVSPVTQRLPGPAGLLCLDYSAFLSYHRSS